MTAEHGGNSDPFKLPDFYRPRPARCSPHLVRVREECAAWARARGLLDDDGPWERGEAAARDHALLAAWAHPDASRADLLLVAEWYVWGFWFDDWFLERFKRSGDRKGATAQVDRLVRFLPVDDGGTPPEPGNPAEAALADLWPRTAAGAGEGWRSRFAEATENLLRTALWELSLREGRRAPNPVEYVEMRRRGGGTWAAALAEYAARAEMPDAVVATRPVRVLRETFADGVVLRNDLFSYRREMKEGEPGNGVLAMERFLECSPQEAAETVNDLLTSRLQQYEHTAVTEVPPLCVEFGLRPDEVARMAAYAEALQDWQAGAHEWHLRSGRYGNGPSARGEAPGVPGSAGLLRPGGLGWSAARLVPDLAANAAQSGHSASPAHSAHTASPAHTAYTANSADTANSAHTARTAAPATPASTTARAERARARRFTHTLYQRVGPSRIPGFQPPSELRVSPHLEASRREYVAWSHRMGLLEPQPGVPASDVWDEERLTDMDLPLAGATMHPDATLAELDVANAWLAWGTYADDYVPAVYGQSRDLAGLKIAVRRLSAFMPLDDPAVTPPPRNALERGLADLWVRTVAPFDETGRRAMRRAVEDFKASWLWEAANQAQHRIPDPVDYKEMRKFTFGSDMTMALKRIPLSGRLPAALLRGETLSRLEEAASECATLINDAASYQKEIEFEGEIHNAVLVVQNFFDCGRPAALRIVGDQMNGRLRQFRHVAEREIPLLHEDFALDAEQRGLLDAYVTDLRNWVTGIHHWHVSVRRYREEDVIRHLPAAVAARRSGSPTTSAHRPGGPGSAHRPGGPGGLGTAAARPPRPAGRAR